MLNFKELGKSTVEDCVEESPSDVLIEIPFPEPISNNWRILHGVLYIFGAILFSVGSFQYFPDESHQTAGAVLFIVGSILFVWGDGMEWWTNNRVGCCLYSSFQYVYEKKLDRRYYLPKNSCIGKYQRAANGLNYFLSVVGALAYLLGSIFFVPMLGTTLEATYLFIVGSAIVCISQIWKIWRLGCCSDENPTNCSFSLFNISVSSLLIKASTGVGGLCYLIGSVYFLPNYDVSDNITYIAALWFTVGSAFYVISAVCLLHSYYVIAILESTKNPQPKKTTTQPGDVNYISVF